MLPPSRSTSAIRGATATAPAAQGARTSAMQEAAQGGEAAVVLLRGSPWACCCSRCCVQRTQCRCTWRCPGRSSRRVWPPVPERCTGCCFRGRMGPGAEGGVLAPHAARRPLVPHRSCSATVAAQVAGGHCSCPTHRKCGAAGARGGSGAAGTKRRDAAPPLPWAQHQRMRCMPQAPAMWWPVVWRGCVTSPCHQCVGSPFPQPVPRPQRHQQVLVLTQLQGGCRQEGWCLPQCLAPLTACSRRCWVWCWCAQATRGQQVRSGQREDCGAGGAAEGG